MVFFLAGSGVTGSPLTLGKSGDGVRLSGIAERAPRLAGNVGTGGMEDLWDAEEPGRDADDPDRDLVDFTEVDSPTVRVEAVRARGSSRVETDSVDVFCVLEVAERRERVGPADALSAPFKGGTSAAAAVVALPLCPIPLLPVDCTMC